MQELNLRFYELLCMLFVFQDESTQWMGNEVVAAEAAKSIKSAV